MEWIRVKDNPPKKNELVLVFQELTGICLRSFSYDADGNWYDEHKDIDDSGLRIIYWMPLLKPPPLTKL